MKELLLMNNDGSCQWVYVGHSGKFYDKDVYDMFGEEIEVKLPVPVKR